MTDSKADPQAGSQAAPRTANRGPVWSGRPLRLLALALSMAVVAVLAGFVTYLVARPGDAASRLHRPSGIPASISTSLVNVMQLSALPADPAPGFTLTDQGGHTLSLSSFRGKAVVLEFMDPHCTDICPIVSQEFVDAYHDLGAAARKVVFIAVNVNQYHTRVADMAAYSRAHQLTAIGDWHFFTGPVPRLRAVWGGYHIAVEARNPKADIVHTSAVYFIDPQGRERFLASPQVDHSKGGAAYLPLPQITEWGHGIAALARLLAGSAATPAS